MFRLGLFREPNFGGGLAGLLSGELASTALAFRYTFIAVGVTTLLSAGVFRWLDEARFKAQPRRT